MGELGNNDNENNIIDSDSNTFENGNACKDAKLVSQHQSHAKMQGFSSSQIY